MSAAGTGTIQLLLVDDDEVDRRHLRRQLSKADGAMEIIMAADLTEARGYIQARHFDAVLLDYLLPGEDGLNLLHDFGDDPTHPVVIVITGQGDERLAAEAMRAGAADYLVKGDLGGKRLATTIRNAVAAAQSERDRQVAVAALERSHRRTRAYLACTQTLLLDIQPSQTLERALADMARGIAADRLILFRVVPSGFEPDVIAKVGQLRGDLPAFVEWKPHWTRWQMALIAGEGLCISQSSGPSAELDALQAQGVAESMAVPFYMHGHWMGFLRADRSTTGDEPFSSEHIHFLQSAADIVTVWREKREE